MTASLTYDDTIALRDGSLATIREIERSDLDAILAMGARCSDESIQSRFFGPRREPTEYERNLITDIDGRDRHALLVESDGEVIAVGRWIRLDPAAVPEVAFLVEDRHQGNGIGALLLDLLAESAERIGYDSLTATVLGDNVHMLRLFDHSDRVTHRTFSGGMWDVTVDLGTE